MAQSGGLSHGARVRVVYRAVSDGNAPKSHSAEQHAVFIVDDRIATSAGPPIAGQRTDWQKMERHQNRIYHISSRHYFRLRPSLTSKPQLREHSCASFGESRFFVSLLKTPTEDELATASSTHLRFSLAGYYWWKHFLSAEGKRYIEIDNRDILSHHDSITQHHTIQNWKKRVLAMIALGSDKYF